MSAICQHTICTCTLPQVHISITFSAARGVLYAFVLFCVLNYCTPYASFGVVLYCTYIVLQWGLWSFLQISEDALLGSCVCAMLRPRQLRTPQPWAHWTAHEANLQGRTGHTRPYSSCLGGSWFQPCSAISSASAHSDGKVCCSPVHT